MRRQTTSYAPPHPVNTSTAAGPRITDYAYPGGFKTQVTEETTGAVSTIQAGPNGEATRVNLSYSYDALGNVTHTNAALVGVSRTLGYDQFNRYTDETIYNPNAPGGLDRGTGYGAGGNINWRTLVGSYDYGENGAPPHAVTTITHQGDLSHYAYDAAGRMTSGGALSAIDWNWSGQVRHLGGTPNVYLHYTPDGDLLTRGVDGEGTARYFGKRFVQLGDGGWRERIVAAGEVIAIVNVSSAGYPSVDYRIADNLGSTAAIVNASGVLEGRYAWNMWGELVNPATYNGSDPDADAKEALTTLGYSGHEMLWKAGLVHTKMRLYNPGTGRWLSPDPIVPNLYNGQSLNRYSYVENNPLTYVDPYGYWSWNDINWNQVALGGIQLVSGAAGAVGGLELAAASAVFGVTFSETGVAIPVGVAGVVAGAGLVAGNLQTEVAGVANLDYGFRGANPGHAWTEADVAKLMHMPGWLAKTTQFLSLTHDLNENLLRGLFVNAAERGLENNINGGASGGGNVSAGGSSLGLVGLPDAGISFTGGIPFETFYSTGALQFSGEATSILQNGGVETLVTTSGSIISCGGRAVARPVPCRVGEK